MPKIRHEVHYGGRMVPAFADRPAQIDAMFRGAVARDPAGIAVVDGKRRMSYAELDDTVDRVAGNLAELGVGKGDRLAILLGNRTAFVETCLACARLGAVQVPINIRQRKPENEYVLAHCGAVAAIYEADLAPQIPDAKSVPAMRLRFAVGGAAPDAAPYETLLQPAPPPPALSIGEDEPFSILYTSGTTGRPKGAILTHFSVIHSCLNYQYGMGLREGDRSILAVPASHVTGLVAIILSMIRINGCTIMMPAFKARTFLELAAAERMTHSLIVPAMYNLCLLEPDFSRFDLAAWRVGGYGGAPMPEATIRRLAEELSGLTLFNVYGATETTSPVTMMPPGEGVAHIDTVGKILPCCDIRIMDDDGREVGPGQPGELWIAGAMVVPGYWDNPDANAANFTHGYWRSGDIGSIDTDGFVRVFDRKKDMINRAGYKVYSAEVENVLTHHPIVVEAAVIGRPDPVLGEKVEAFIVAREAGASAADIRAFCAERLSDYKVPDHVTFLSEPLPRNANGKVLKGELRDRIAAESASSSIRSSQAGGA
ncbi:MAG: class I adenylate-forming enzyme family protein [Gammaproteobacteria bacterium]